MLLDTSRKGPASVFKDWQLAVVDYLSEGQEAISRDVWIHVNKESEWGRQVGNSISRASVINFLNKLGDDEELLIHREESGKGGYHRIYSMEIGRPEFFRRIVSKFVVKLNEINEREVVGQVLSQLKPVNRKR